MRSSPDETALTAWKHAYRTLQASDSDACLTDEQLLAMVSGAMQGAARTDLADHIVQCQRCTDAYQWLLRWRAPGM